MAHNALRFISVMLVAVAFGGGSAHLFALPNKMALNANEYLSAQRAYRGWALLGIPIFAALAATILLAWMERRRPRQLAATTVAILCIVGSLAIFFTFTYPANQATENWTRLPDNWESLRRQWEFSHAAGAVLYFIALGALTWSLLLDRPARRADSS